MDISDEVDGRGDLLNVGFVHEDFLNTFANLPDSGFIDNFFLLNPLKNPLNIHGLATNMIKILKFKANSRGSCPCAPTHLATAGLCPDRPRQGLSSRALLKPRLL